MTDYIYDEFVTPIKDRRDNMMAYVKPPEPVKDRLEIALIQKAEDEMNVARCAAGMPPIFRKQIDTLNATHKTTLADETAELNAIDRATSDDIRTLTEINNEMANMIKTMLNTEHKTPADHIAAMNADETRVAYDHIKNLTEESKYSNQRAKDAMKLCSEASAESKRMFEDLRIAIEVERAKQHEGNQYYYRNEDCSAADQHQPDCTCWHDQGTGPYPSAYPADPGTTLSWRVRPAVGTQRSDGSTANYYQLPPGATELQDLISFRDMNAQDGEIFRAIYRKGRASHSDELRDAKKVLFYAQAEVDRLERFR
jgi:hypothetical protein